MADFPYKCLKVAVVPSYQVHVSCGPQRAGYCLVCRWMKGNVVDGAIHERDPLHQTAYLNILNP